LDVSEKHGFRHQELAYDAVVAVVTRIKSREELAMGFEIIF
jgi:hypothetical protein